jgi:histidinol phosphatase-like enzyme
MSDYALWNREVFERMREKHAQGFKLVIFANRTGIKGAMPAGENAKKVKSLVDWIGHSLEVYL